MKRYLWPAILSLLAVTASATPNEIQGELTVAHGWVKGTNGVPRSIKGMKLPYRAVKIDAEKVSPVNRPNGKDKILEVARQNRASHRINPGGWNIQPAANSSVYSTDYGVYGYAELNPSSLDDIVLTSTAQNKPWTNLGFGFNYGQSNFQNFLIRWRIWQTNTENPVGQNDFTGEIADFGVIWNQTVSQGAWFVTIDISQAGVITNDTSLFMAQQFRTTQANGEGNFLSYIDTVFNGTANPPAIGSSENQFWYDWDPLDGKYENTEVDTFETTRADHAWVIQVNDSAIVNTLLPNKATVTSGTYESGTFDSLQFFDDGDVFVINPRFNVARTAPIGTVEVEANCPTATPKSMKFDLVASSSTANMRVTVDLYNYVLGTWVEVGTTVVGNSPATLSAPYGGLLPLSSFVSETTPRKVRARIKYKNLTGAVPRNIDLRADLFNWVITR